MDMNKTYNDRLNDIKENGKFSVHPEAIECYKTSLKYKNKNMFMQFNDEMIINRINALYIAGTEASICKNYPNRFKTMCNGVKLTYETDTRCIRWIAVYGCNGNDFKYFNQRILKDSLNTERLENLKRAYTEMGLSYLGNLKTNDKHIYNTRSNKVNRHDLFRDITHKFEINMEFDSMICLTLLQKLYSNKRIYTPVYEDDREDMLYYYNHQLNKIYMYCSNKYIIDPVEAVKLAHKIHYIMIERRTAIENKNKEHGVKTRNSLYKTKVLRKELGFIIA